MRIDVILKTYRGRRWIHEAVESVVAQTYPDWHLTVVDDACPDATGEYVAERFADRRVTIKRLGKNLGPIGAQLSGVRATRGDAVAFIDQDDRWHPEKLAMQAARLESDPSLDAVHTDVRHIDSSGREIVGGADRENERRAMVPYESLTPRELARALYRSYTLRVITTLARRPAIVEAGLLQDEPASDWEFWVRFAATGHRMAHVAQPLADRRFHTDQFSRTQRADRIDVHLRASDYLAQRFPEVLGDLARERRGTLLDEKVRANLRRGDGRAARQAISELRRLRGDGAALRALWLASWPPLLQPIARIYRRSRSRR